MNTREALEAAEGALDDLNLLTCHKCDTELDFDKTPGAWSMYSALTDLVQHLEQVVHDDMVARVSDAA